MLINKTIPVAFILSKIKFDVVLVLIIGLLVNSLSDDYINFSAKISLNFAGFIGIGTLIALVFNLSHFYDSWLEVGKIWDKITSESKNLVLQLQSFVNKEKQQVINEIALRQIAWCYSLSQSLRDLNPTDNIGNLITHEDWLHLESKQSKTYTLMQLNSIEVTKLRNYNALTMVDEIKVNITLANLSNAMTMAQRIKNTVFPAIYRLFLYLFIYIFVISLAIALNRLQVYWLLPIMLIISSALFFLEKSAIYLQSPFINRPTEMTLTNISQQIERDIRKLINENEGLKTRNQETYYIL